MAIRYLAFAGDSRFINGGALDLQATGDEHQLGQLVDQMFKLVKSEKDSLHWFNILDISDMKIVALSQQNASHNVEFIKEKLSSECIVFTCKNLKWGLLVGQEYEDFVSKLK